ncbi:unnamed protein product [Soboliphyme baturini]|uniref:FA complementation group C n=1 Tax=Soboliphyme baturini TaxID=241478 RepID=A0A183J3W7_9BILA|nr:unnamed protein product [Soboliphyme baturini]
MENVIREDQNTRKTWILSSCGRKYLQLQFSPSQLKSMLEFCEHFSSRRPISSLDYIECSFKRHILIVLFESVLLRQNHGKTRQMDLGTDINEYKQCLMQMKTGYSTFCLEEELIDETCLWWIELLTCAYFWKNGRLKEARQKYLVIKSIPKSLLKKNLALAVVHSFCAVKLSVEDTKRQHVEQLIWIHCVQARKRMRLYAQETPQDTFLENLALALSVDWQLQSLIKILSVVHGPQRSTAARYVPRQLKLLYSEGLVLLRRTVVVDHRLQLKDLLHEVCWRILNNMNPIVTKQIIIELVKAANEPLLKLLLPKMCNSVDLKIVESVLKLS